MVSEQRQGGQVRDCKVVHGVGVRMIINRKLNRILRIGRELGVSMGAQLCHTDLGDC